MKKLLYLCLAVAFIFTACKKEDDTPTSTPPVSTTSIVGVWIMTSYTYETKKTYYDEYGSVTWIDSYSVYYDPYTPNWEDKMSPIEFYTNGNYTEEDHEPGTYTYSNTTNMLIINYDGDIDTMHATVTATTLTYKKNYSILEQTENGFERWDFEYDYTFYRNKSNFKNAGVKQRKGNSSLFKKNNLLKKIKR